MDLEKIIHKELHEIIESGIIEKKIKEVLTESIENTIESAMRSYSDFGKALEKKFSEAFNADLKSITIPEYGSKMLSYITDELDNHLKNETEKVLKERINEFFKPLEKNEYTVSEIVEMYKDSIEHNYTDDYDNIPESHEFTAFIDKSSTINDTYFDLMLDPEPDQSRYNCEYKIRIEEKKGIWHIDAGGHDLHKTKTQILDRFERALFMMFSQKIKIINDEDNINNYIASSFD